jgi:hypothetical protein
MKYRNLVSPVTAEPATPGIAWVLYTGGAGG